MDFENTLNEDGGGDMDFNLDFNEGKLGDIFNVSEQAKEVI